MGTLRDLKGMRFGKLEVLQRGKNCRGRVAWDCLCDCGNFCTIQSQYLLAGDTKSCGCLFSEALIKRNTKHGRAYTQEYSHWKTIKQRCFNKNDPDYKNYGGRGITMQTNWVNDFQAFLSYVGEKPKDGKRYSIDRLDNSKGYEEGNIRWATDTPTSNEPRYEEGQ